MVGEFGGFGVRGKFYLFLCGVLTFDRKYIWVGSGYFYLGFWESFQEWAYEIIFGLG